MKTSLMNKKLRDLCTNYYGLAEIKSTNLSKEKAFVIKNEIKKKKKKLQPKIRSGKVTRHIFRSP